MTRPVADPSGSPLRPSASREVLLGERTLPRVAIAFPVRLHGDDAGAPHYARSCDLSVEGVGIESPLSLDLDEIRGVTLATPAGRIDLAAEGCWQEATPAEDGFRVGIRFLDVEAIALRQLWDLIHGQTRSLMQCLAQVRELEAANPDDILDLIHLARLREVQEEGVVYQQGSRAPGGDSIFFIMHGKAAIDAHSAGGRRIALAHAGPGELIGGLALVANVPADESATAVRDTRLIEITSAAFAKLKHTNPLLALELAATVMRAHLTRRANPFDRLHDMDASILPGRKNPGRVHREGEIR